MAPIQPAGGLFIIQINEILRAQFGDGQICKQEKAGKEQPGQTFSPVGTSNELIGANRGLPVPLYLEWAQVRRLDVQLCI
jgi:hypothetical protein